MHPNTSGANEKKIIVLCDHCFQKIRLPKRDNKLRVTCPTCRHEFDYQYNVFGFSPSSKKHLVAGLVGALAGASLVEVASATLLIRIEEPLLDALLTFAIFGTCLGAIMGAADGYYRKNSSRMYYGLRVGALLGLVSGAISGVIAQMAFGALLASVAPPEEPSFGLLMFARTVGWSVLGLLLGIGYGIKENTSGDLKYGLIGGALGGAVGGLLFDPLSLVVQLGDGTVGRLMGFLVLGMAISVTINHFRETAITSNQPEMYQPLTRRLPTNPRLLLPSASHKQPPSHTPWWRQSR
jgi:hypothetical protein